jgi:Membrane bound beta barrel domain (DUF5777)
MPIQPKIFIIALLFGLSPFLHAQSGLLDMLEDEETTDYTIATFKSNRVVNGQSIETIAFGDLLFVVQHRFGRISGGAYEFFGLDQSNTRLALEYGISDRLNVGIGRSSFEKMFDGYLKYKWLRQSSGKKNMPVTLTLYANMAIKTLKWADPNRVNFATSRYYYTFQMFLARKFNSRFSAQLSPTLVHRNLVLTKKDKNDVFAIGIGGRYKVSGSVSINLEYFYVFPNQVFSKINGETQKNALSVGVDIETGGHVFQIMLSNSRGMVENQFITETTGSWGKGDIHLGFNIHRTFTIVNKEKRKLKKEKQKKSRG